MAHRPAHRLAILLAALGLALALAAPASAAIPTRIAAGPSEIVPIPASIPHDPGDMVDRRIVPNLRWLAQRYPIYVTDGYSGKLPLGGEQVGCKGCHMRGSDHHNGLAVDIVPVGGSARCDASWAGITRLARWAEPRQDRPRAPFRWVGYDGDAGHGCGHHLHLSWQHAESPEFALAQWVQLFTLGPAPASKPTPKPARKPQAGTRSTGLEPASDRRPEAAPKGGISAVRAGGLSTR